MPTFKAKVVDEKSGDALQIVIEGRKTLTPKTFDDLISKLREQFPELQTGPSAADEEMELTGLEKKDKNLMSQGQ